MNEGYYYNLGLKFDFIARKQPSAIALRFQDGEEWSYGRCNELSSRCAHFLLDLGVLESDVVAIVSDKHPMAFVVMLAALKIGVAYVNLDAESPLERLEKILDKTGSHFVFFEDLTEEVGSSLEKNNSIRGINLDDDVFASLLEGYSSDIPNVTSTITGSAPAYVMFTSGSTGIPKGALIPHNALINFSSWARAAIGYDETAVFTNVNPLHFDNSVFDFYASLFQGATLVPFRSKLLRHPLKLVSAVEKANCTVWFSVPSLLVYLMRMRSINSSSLQNLQTLVFGGEGFQKNPLRKIYELLGDRVELLNVYGPTECTCICSIYRVSELDMKTDDLLPLGTIAENFSFLILDENDNLTPDGQIGELVLRGPNVGMGYLNDKQRTADNFQPVPTLSGYKEQCYRTGDLVRFDRASGLLYFCGRQDNQVKRMGYRIELEEVESAIGSIPGINECVCIFERATSADVGQIIAYFVGDQFEVEAIRSILSTKIPKYMMPNDFVQLDILPKNRNGKIDRLALSEGRLQ